MEMQVVLLFGFGCRNLDAGFLGILSSHFFCLTFHSFSGMFLKLYYNRPYNSFRDHYDSWLKLRKYQYFDGAFKSNNFFMPWTIKSEKCFHVQVFKLFSKWLWQILFINGSFSNQLKQKKILVEVIVYWSSLNFWPNWFLMLETWGG